MKNKSPQLTVGLPVFNGEKFVGNAIECMLEQTYSDYVFIISDNASTDATQDICRQYEKFDKRIKYYRNEQNLGAAKNFELLYQKVETPFWTPISHDDYFSLNFLEACLNKLIENPAVVLAAPSQIAVINANGFIKRAESNFNTTGMSLAERLCHMLDRIMWVSFYGVSRTRIFGEVWSNIAPYKTRFGADVIFLAGMLLKGQIAAAEGTTFFYREADTEKSATVYAQDLLPGQAVATMPYTGLLESILEVLFLFAEVPVEQRKTISDALLQTVLKQPSWAYQLDREQRAQEAATLPPMSSIVTPPAVGPGPVLPAAAVQSAPVPAPVATRTDGVEAGGKFGINVVGHISGNLGLGVSARSVVKSLLENNIPIAIFDIDPGLGRGRKDLTFAQYHVKSLDELVYPITLFMMPPTIGWLKEALPGLFPADKLLVAYSMWELPVLPTPWMQALESFDVLVAGSEFIRHAFEFNLSKVQTIVTKHPLYLPDNITGDRQRFSLPADKTIFVTAFEPNSDPVRKNPRGALRAFLAAFPDDDSVCLVIKINNAYSDGILHPSVVELQRIANADDRIVFVTASMPYIDVLGLYASCDVFVSLHRAEGLGLGLMEAMALGKPVIATGWSGNMSFMDHTCACLVPYVLIPVNGSIPAYTIAELGREAKWAEPSLAHASAWMRQLAAAPELRNEIGQAAARAMAMHHKQASAAGFVSELHAIWQHKQFLPHAVEIDEGAAALTGLGVLDQAYQTWRNKHSIQEIDAQILAERMVMKWKTKPVFHFVVLVVQGQQKALADVIDNLSAQMYGNWRLTVVADFASPDAAFNQSDTLQWIQMQSEWPLADVLNVVVDRRKDDWFSVTAPGFALEPQALLVLSNYINAYSDWQLIYTDEDRLELHGRHADARFKPEFNLEWLRAANYMGDVIFCSGRAIDEVGGFADLPGAYQYDLSLRLYERFGGKGIGHISEVLVSLTPQFWSLGDAEGEMQAVRSHLQRLSIEAEVVDGYQPGTRRVAYQWKTRPPVSIIIPNKDSLEYLQPCLQSVFEKTQYPVFEVLVVDNGSTDPDVLEYYELMLRQEPRLRLLRDPQPFNFSAMNNLAAREARGEYLVLLNNDTQIVQGDWLARMLSYGQRPDVGVVGARLVYPETSVLQHAGVVLGMQGVADHIFNGQLKIDEPGYLGRAHVDQEYSAVTAACMLVRKALYDQVGGLDEGAFKVSYNDVDLCLKIGALNYKIIWTPYATVVHHGSVSQKASNVDLMKRALNAQRFEAEQHAMLRKWLPQLANDPAYNRHLSLMAPDCRAESSIVVDWDPHFHDRQRILGVPLTGASGEYRVISPFRALSRAGLAQTTLIQAGKMFETRVMLPVELERAAPDVLVMQAAVDDRQLRALDEFKQFNSGVKRIFTLDDLVTQIPQKSSFYRHSYRDAKPRLRKALSLCDRAIVSTEPLAELCRPMIEDVKVVPNRLEAAIWGGLTSQRGSGKKPRVGWAGAQQHAGDLAWIQDVVKETANEVEWVFLGMCPDEIRSYVHEFHDFVLSFYDYPAKLASLNLDLAIAPLEIHAFNEAKSNLRLLEYGAMGWPVICTDIYPYQTNAAPVCRLPNNVGAWVNAIRERIYDLQSAYREGDRLKAWVEQNYILENHLDDWFGALAR